MYEIVQDILDARRLTQTVASNRDGAVVTFAGIVRGKNRGKKVLFLEYEAYPEMAIRMMKRIGDEIQKTWGLTSVAMQHRVGRLNVGETSVLIVVSAPHRDDAFAACQYAINRFKRIVPVWKKEIFEDGELWVEGPVETVEAAKE
ncbi:MAG TPA: molybdenum cofactor biosynthesis protein MoaE [Vicinamibacteria bacterium]|jgi:molybdopterin synthase catalytic subunit|nr:molybdenum cofactor biosynthesis protein MoaE [Vicinamibacteria bacterium]